METVSCRIILPTLLSSTMNRWKLRSAGVFHGFSIAPSCRALALDPWQAPGCFNRCLLHSNILHRLQLCYDALADSRSTIDSECGWEPRLQMLQKLLTLILRQEIASLIEVVLLVHGVPGNNASPPIILATPSCLLSMRVLSSFLRASAHLRHSSLLRCSFSLLSNFLSFFLSFCLSFFLSFFQCLNGAAPRTLRNAPKNETLSAIQFNSIQFDHDSS